MFDTERDKEEMTPFCFGKQPPKIDSRTLRFENYLTGAVPDPPASYNALTRVYQNLSANDPTVLFPMNGNDKYGDCTIAALAHAITVYRGLIKQEVIMSEQAVEQLYFSLTGGQDSGLVELDVLNYWRKNSVDGDEISAYVSINPKNHKHVKQAIKLFGGVYLGFRVTSNCVQEFQNRQPWMPGLLTNEGHAVFAIGYDAGGLTVLTWGNTQVGVWPWWDECVDEAYAILPPEAQNDGFAPGFNYQQLVSDLQAVSN